MNVHYHWNDTHDGLRVCSLDDELRETTFWVAELSTEPAPAPNWDGWTELGYTTDDG